jgi:hypothetical protein
VRLVAVNEDVLLGALRTAWKLRVELNAKTRKRPPSSRPKSRSRNPVKK